jgi:hypothetical protein
MMVKGDLTVFGTAIVVLSQRKYGSRLKLKFPAHLGFRGDACGRGAAAPYPSNAPLIDGTAIAQPQPNDV